MPSIRKSTFALGAVWLTCIAPPAFAVSGSTTRIVRCDPGNCLLVSGHRDNAGLEVRISGHAVKVEGRRSWRTRVPLDAVRDWSAPFARTVEITLYNPESQSVLHDQAILPIGLMGHTELASLIVGVR